MKWMMLLLWVLLLQIEMRLGLTKSLAAPISAASAPSDVTQRRRRREKRQGVGRQR